MYNLTGFVELLGEVLGSYTYYVLKNVIKVIKQSGDLDSNKEV